ncbi:MAG: hypothetical protein KJZ75_17445 [Hyphomonadaceae bacterium]|nr:hypothetical protein [Hyphomonadaceae bacterium]
MMLSRPAHGLAQTLGVSDEIQFGANALPGRRDTRMILRLNRYGAQRAHARKALCEPMIDLLQQNRSYAGDVARLERMFRGGNHRTVIHAGRAQTSIARPLAYPVKANHCLHKRAVRQNAGVAPTVAHTPRFLKSCGYLFLGRSRRVRQRQIHVSGFNGPLRRRSDRTVNAVAMRPRRRR